jgi:hypothetical protein
VRRDVRERALMRSAGTKEAWKMIRQQLRGVIRTSKSSLIRAVAVLPLLVTACAVEPADEVGTASQGLGPDCAIRMPYAWSTAAGTCYMAGPEYTLHLAPGESSDEFTALGGVFGTGHVTLTCNLNGNGLWTEHFKSCRYTGGDEN